MWLTVQATQSYIIVFSSITGWISIGFSGSFPWHFICHSDWSNVRAHFGRKLEKFTSTFSLNMHCTQPNITVLLLTIFRSVCASWHSSSSDYTLFIGQRLEIIYTLRFAMVFLFVVK